MTEIGRGAYKRVKEISRLYKPGLIYIYGKPVGVIFGASICV